MDDAAEELKTAIKLNPKYWFPLDNLGLVRLRRKQLDKAKLEFETAIKLNQKFHNFYLHLGYVLALKGDQVEARKQWQHASEINKGKSPSDRMYRPLYQVALGDGPGGVAEMQKVLEELKPPLGLVRSLLDESDLLAKSPAAPAKAAELYQLLRAAEEKLKTQL